MIKTQILLWKTIEGNRKLRVRVIVRFLLFYSELTSTDLRCNMFQTLLGRKKYEEEMSDEHALAFAGIGPTLTLKHFPNAGAFT